MEEMREVVLDSSVIVRSFSTRNQDRRGLKAQRFIRTGIIETNNLKY